ncbi:MAG: hypothetical protein CMH83_12335 [Nocardioides sp.]|nr:hypothetical protein [Nocardioides sp.]
MAFTHALRGAGVPVTPDRGQAFLDAAAAVGADDATAVRVAGRATLCGSPDDLARFDQVFVEFFDHRTVLPRRRDVPPRAPAPTSLPLSDETGDGDGREDADEDVVRAAASAVERLRHRDVADLSAGERERLNALLAGLPVRPPLRRVARHEPWRRGTLDARRTLRDSLRRAGEPGRVAWRRRAVRPRRVVLLVDVSGSMAPYADALLRLAHRLTSGCAAGAAGGGRVETFALGTRLTHLTRAMRLRDPERALVAAGDAVPDWSGGTRLGETLQAFDRRWGRRGLARGAVVVVLSDGWERGDCTLLAEQVARLQRASHRLVWVNPHRGKAGYQPVQAGVRAVLPFVDDFVAGHSVATFAALLRIVEGDRRA